MNTKFNKLTDKKIFLSKKIYSLNDVIKGSIYTIKRFCGKKNCKCKRENSPHTSLVLSITLKGGTKLIPIKKNQVTLIKRWGSNYKRLKKYIDDLVITNSQLLRIKE